MGNVHFISIGGSVMHSLAISLKKIGYNVSGSDDKLYEPSASRLKFHGLYPNSLGWDTNNINDNLDFVILGMHAKKDNPELLKAQDLGLEIYSYPDFIFKVSQTKTRIVIGGSHGKTSITSMILHVLQNNNIKSLYGLVANAGIGGENTYGGKDRWREVIETNLTGTYQTIQECLPYLKKDEAPFKKVVVISSILARLGVPGYSAYCASKAGLLGLTRSLAAEHSGNKILINAICPGWVNTDMAQEGIDGFADALKITKEQAYQEAMKQVPLSKMSEPEEIAQFISYLFSEQQTSLTGQTIDINNGALMP